MDRFDDGRSRKRTSYDDPRDTRLREHDEETKVGDKPQKPKSVKELIEEEAAIEAGYKKELAEATDNGKISPRSMFLQQAQREELLDKMCAIYDKHRKLFQTSYEGYRKELYRLRNEKEEFGKKMYLEGRESGFAKGASEKAEELMPDIEYSRRSARRYRLFSWLLGAYGLIATAVVLGLLW